MDYQAFINTVNKTACVISLKINPDGTQGPLCVEAANDLYLKSVNVDPKDFVPGRPYIEYVPRKLSFEGLTIKSAVINILLHNYLYDQEYNGWLDNYFIPLASDREDTKYVLFTYDMTPESDAEKLSDITPSAAVRAVKTSVMLREGRDFKKTMQTVIENIREDCKASGCSLILTDFEKRSFKFLGNSIAADDRNDKVKDFDEDSFFRVIETWDRLIAGGNCLLIMGNLEEFKKKNPEWYESMSMLGIENIALYPLRAKGKTIGYFWVTNFATTNMLHTRQVLELTSFLLASEVSNYILYKEMEKISVTDLLTNTYNRNAMNNRITDIVEGKYKLSDQYGVVFVDMNGLKNVNDKKGHVAGDNLLKDAADTLKKIYAGCDVYRVGGDEFLVIVENKSKEEFDDMLGKIKALSDNSETMKFAIGSCFAEASFDIRKAMHEADVKMYEDKEHFYNKYPELSRRKI
ncbi:MAG: GGDEF domain-containing protein [Lachnospiraceae bacterium]|nr:GGDEF domain-containing protein [Lachnospiraceae bacterium]